MPHSLCPATQHSSTTPADDSRGFSFIRLRVAGRLGAEGSKKCGHGSSKVVAFQAKHHWWWFFLSWVELGCGDCVILRNEACWTWNPFSLKACYDCVQAERCQERKWQPHCFGGRLCVLESCFYPPLIVFEKEVLTTAMQPA